MDDFNNITLNEIGNSEKIIYNVILCHKFLKMKIHT